MNNITVKRLVWNALLLALLVVCSYISFPIGTVNITLQVFAVFLIVLLSKSFDAIIITCLYAIMGTIGLPVFSSFSAGGFASATYGFILGFILSSILIYIYNLLSKNNNNYHLLIKGIIVLIGIYVIGLPYACLILKSDLFSMLVYFLPYIAIDILKMIFASFVYKRLAKIL